ncbi:MAG TPA: hypothetical protein DHW07_02490 [Gammaproteobacteria bacterium]|nr:hypothetical protein [Gammaproteobacteria bacterium]
MGHDVEVSLIFLPFPTIFRAMAGTKRLGKWQGYLGVITIEIVGAPATNPVHPISGIPSASIQGTFDSLRDRSVHSNGQKSALKGDLNI